MSGDRAAERLDHSAGTVRTAVGALCRQLQAAADSVAVLPGDEARRAAADQLVARGVASAIRVTRPADGADRRAADGAQGASGATDGRGGVNGRPVSTADNGDGGFRTDGAPGGTWIDCAAPATASGGGVIAATAETRDGDDRETGTVEAGLILDQGFAGRLARTSGAEVTVLALSGGALEPAELWLSTEPEGRRRAVVEAAVTPGESPDGRHVRRIDPAPGQPLAVVISVAAPEPGGLYTLLLAAVLGACGLGVLASRWLARSTTRTLAEVAHAADMVAGGDLSARVPGGGPDEVGRLADSFNRMTGELQDHVQALTTSRDQLRRHLSILGDTLSGTHDVQRILRVILDTAVAATGARAGAVLLVDPADGMLVGQAAEGLAGRWDGADVSALRVPVGAGLLGGVAAAGEPRHGHIGHPRPPQPTPPGPRQGAQPGSEQAGPAQAAQPGPEQSAQPAPGPAAQLGPQQSAQPEPGQAAIRAPGPVVPEQAAPRQAAAEVAQADQPVAGEPLPRSTWMAVPICAPKLVGDPLVPGTTAEPSAGGASVVLGVLALYDRHGADGFDDADLDMLRTFAGQAGVAVNNVRVHEEAQRLSLTDPLTGLWNYRSLQESVRREVERASRFRRMLCVLALDLDHFKEVNDTHGHAAGDAVLREFAQRIRGCLREVDLAFRQGGEEFVVLLPETDAFGGAIVAERLGAVIRGAAVEIGGRRGARAIPVSVSIGIAVYPEHGVTAGQLLEAADEALYAAKEAGRDTYRLAELGGDVAEHGAAGRAEHGAAGRTEHGAVGRTEHGAAGRTEHGAAGRNEHAAAGRAEHGPGADPLTGPAAAGNAPAPAGVAPPAGVAQPGGSGAPGGPQPPRARRGR
ncbi:diguanylate cyclase [Spirilliplanes yamanashiensis]|uniref:diguanylate cyclase n=1 Tax=Spirilliplanes yamanashiensis TaxID=42233 RepID=UPI00194DEF24|nr:diguanylate cyclase (GGDEF)-like protein [Spirilliplanes yamanashiensis]